MHPAINFLPLRLRLTRNRPRVVFTFHDLRIPYLFPKAGIVRRWVTLFPGRWSDAVIATDEEDYEQLAQALGPLQSRLRCIPIGSNIHPQPPPGYDRHVWRRGLGVTENELLLCYFGFLNESKGGETLIRSLSVLRRRGYAVKLLMVGGQVGDSDPSNVIYFEQVKSLGQELDLTDWILWTGYTEPEMVSANLIAADVCVLPYRDGASYRRGSLMAALAHGLPIVSTKSRPTAGETMPRPTAGETSPRPATRTLVNGENIVLVPVDDPHAIADEVGRLLSDPERRTKLSDGALDLAKSFTWDRIASQTARLYTESRHLTGDTEEVRLD
jgi:glycosyltransferase involved in cell wall biosynthesis